MSNYLSIDDEMKIVISNEPFNNPDFAFKDRTNDAIYPCELFTPYIINKDVCSIKGRNINISDLTVILMDDVESLDERTPNDVFIKDVKHKLPDPYKDKLQPFTAAIVLLCKSKGKNIPLNEEQHKLKLGIQLSIMKMVNTDKEITLKKAIELLEYYDLNIVEIIRDEYIVGNK